MDNIDDITNDADVKYRIMVDDTWMEVTEELYNMWMGPRMMDGSDVGLPTIWEGRR